MKKYITNFLRKKKGVGEFTAKVLTVGNLKRVISILLLLSMLITSNAVSTLAGSKPQKYGNSETANETEKETTPNETGEFYAESKNDNELNGIDEDIKIDDKKVGSENDKIDNTNETENENNENTNSDNETINKNDNDIAKKDDENKIDNEYEEEKEEDDEDNGSKGSQRFAPTNGETNDNETNGDKGSQSFVPANGDTNDNETSNDDEGSQSFAPTNGDTNDNEINDNEATDSDADSSKTAENKVDENLTNYIDLFIKNAKTGQTENNWKIVKVLMKNGDDNNEDISLSGNKEEDIKQTLTMEEAMLSPIVSVVIEDDYGLKKVVEVVANWEKVYDEKEIIDIAKNSDRFNVAIGYRLDKNKLIKEVQDAISGGVEKFKNYEGNEEIRPIYIPEDIKYDVLEQIIDRSYEELELEGLITKKTNNNETNDDEGSQASPLQNNETNDNETNDDEGSQAANSPLDYSPLQKNETNDNEIDDTIEQERQNRYGNGEEENIEETEKYDISNYIKDEELLEKVVEKYKKQIRQNVLGEGSEEEVAIVKRSKKLGSGEKETTTDDFELPTINKNMQYGASSHSHNGSIAPVGIRVFTDREKVDKDYLPISTWTTSRAKLQLIAFILSGRKEHWFNFYIDENNFDFNKFFKDGKPQEYNRFGFAFNYLICLNGKSVKNFYIGGTLDNISMSIFNCSNTESKIYNNPNKWAYIEGYLSYFSILSKGGEDFYDRGPIKFVNSGNLKYWAYNQGAWNNYYRSTMFWVFKGINFNAPLFLYPQNDNTRRDYDYRPSYYTSGITKDPRCDIINCTFDYNDNFSIDLGKVPVLTLDGMDEVYLKNVTFKNFNVTENFIKSNPNALNTPLVRLRNIDRTYFEKDVVFDNCSTGLSMYYKGNSSATGRWDITICKNSQMTFKNCNQPKGGNYTYNKETVGLFNVYFDEKYSYGPDISNWGYSSCIIIGEQNEDSSSLLVTNSHLIGPAINIENNRFNGNEKEMLFRVWGASCISVENNTYDYERELKFKYGGTDRTEVEKSLPVGIRLTYARAYFGGGVHVQNNTILSIKNVFNDANSFKKYIETTDKNTTVRPTSVHTTAYNYPYLEGGIDVRDFDLGYVMESPDFPDEYKNAAKIDNSNKDYFGGLVMAKRNKNGTTSNDDEGDWYLSYGTDSEEKNYKQKLYNISIQFMNDENYVSKYLLGNDRKGKRIAFCVPRIWTGIEKVDNWTWRGPLYYPENIGCPIVAPKANYNNHNPVIQFGSSRQIVGNSNWYTIFFAGEATGGGGSGSGTGTEYSIEYRLTEPKDYSWKSVLGGKETSMIQYAKVNSKIKLFDAMWTSEDTEQIGWTLTKDSNKVDFALGEELNNGINGASVGKNIILYPVWLFDHKHIACGCDTNSCKHTSEIKTIFTNNGMNNSNEIEYNEVNKVEDLTGNGNFYLRQDIIGNKVITVNGTLNLCLSGRKLDGITFNGNGVINITNCSSRQDAQIIVGTNNIFGSNLTVNLIQKPNTNKKILIKNEKVSFGKKGVLYGTEISPSKDSIKTGSVVSNGDGLTVIDTDIKGYRANGTNVLYPFSKTTFIGNVNINGENSNYSLVELGSGVKLKNANIKINNSKVDYAGVLTINQVAGDNKITVENSSIEVNSNTIKGKNADLSIVSFASNELLDITNNVKITISSNKVSDNNYNDKIFAALRFTENQKLKAQNTTLIIKDNTGHTGKTDSLYQVYSENSNGFIELTGGNSGKFSKNTVMTVAFSTKYGNGTIVTNWNKDTVEDMSKVGNMFIADKRKFDDLVVKQDSEEQVVRISGRHTHKVCGEEGSCSNVCGVVGTTHTELFVYKKIASTSEISEMMPEIRTFELAGNIGNDSGETIISGSGMISICLSGYNLTNVTFTGYEEIYITNCNMIGKKGIIKNVKYPDSAFVGIGGTKEIEIRKTDSYIINTNKNSYLKNVKIVKDTNGSVEEIITKSADLMLAGPIEISGFEIADRLIRKVDKLIVGKGEIKISNNKFTADRSIIEVGQDVSELEVVGGAKLELVGNSISKGSSNQAVIKINEGKNILVDGSSLEIKNTKFINCVEEETGENKRQGLINGIHVETNATIDIKDSGVVIVNGFETDSLETEQNVNISVHPVGVYSLNTAGFVNLIGEVSNLTRMSIMFPNGGTNGRGTITKEFNKEENLATTIFRADTVLNNDYEVSLRTNKDVVIGIIGAGYYISYRGGDPVGHDTSIMYEVEGGNLAHQEVAKYGSSGKIIYSKTNWFSVNGFTFIGWSPYITGYGPDGKEDIVKAGGERDDFNLAEGEEQVVYAIWEQDTYSVIYSANTLQKNGETIYPIGIKVERTGYCTEVIDIFDNINERGGEHFTARGLKIRGFKRGDIEYELGQKGVSFSAKKGEKIELNAVWDDKKYTVSFNSGSYQNPPMKSGKSYADGQYAYYEDINVEAPYDFDNAEKDFEGWEITNIETSDGRSIDSTEIGRKISKNTKTISKLVDIDECNIELTAKWQNPSYEIVYKGGVPKDKYGVEYKVTNTSDSGTNPTRQERVEETVKLLSTETAPFRAEGFVIEGWSKDERITESSVIYKTAEINALSNKKDDVVTLYAVWKEVEYTIRYYMNGTSAQLAQETTTYYDNTSLRSTVGTSYVTNDTIGRGWKLVKVEWEEDGSSKTQNFTNPRILRGTTAKKYGLTDKNNATVTLYVNWVSKSDVHNHKLCGLNGNETCSHIGDAHYDNLIYESFVDVATMKELMSSNTVTNIVLEDNFRNNSLLELEIAQGKTLNICLNGNKMENIRFSGVGNVNISNCSRSVSTYSVDVVDINMFEGCSVGIYGKDNNIVVTTEMNSGNIQYVFFQTTYTVIYETTIKGIRGVGLGEFASNSSNRWEKTTISDNVNLNDYLVNDSGIVLKNCTVKNNEVKAGAVFSNIDVTIEGSETNITNNKSSQLIFDLRRLNINGSKVNITSNEGDRNNSNPTNENSGLIRIKVGLNISNKGQLIIEKNRSKKSTLAIDNYSVNNSEVVMGDGTLLKVNNNTIDVVGIAENNAAMRYDTINNTEIRGAIEVTNNKFTGSGVGLRVLRGKIRVGSTYLKVKGNTSNVSSETVVEVLSDVNTGFIEMVDSSSRFDVENSEMQVAFKNSNGQGYGGTIFIGFVDRAIKQVGDKTKNDWYNVVFKADTIYHSYTLLSVKLEEEGTTGTSVKIVQVDPYKIIYKGGEARKNGGGTEVVKGNEYTQNVEGKTGIQLLKNNEGYSAEAFNFAGWTTIENAGYNDEKVTIFRGNSPIPDLDYARTSLNGEDVVYLYGVWKEYTYTIEYNKAAAAAQGDTDPQTVHYYDPVRISVSGFSRTGYDVESWQVSSIKTSSGVNATGNGIAVGNTIRPTTVLRELLKEDGGVIVLNAIWVAVSSDGLHKHKDCGQYNSVACIHDGVERHSVNNTEYRSWTNEDVTDISGSGYYYLANSITRNNKVINASGKLVICLNGKNLTGVRFTGSGEVIITNCANYNATVTAPSGNSALFQGVSGRIYGKIEITVKANRLALGNSFKSINGIFEPVTDTTETYPIVSINDDQEFGMSNVKFMGYKTTNNLLTILGAKRDKDLGIYELKVEGGSFRNIISFDNTTMDVSLVEISNVEVSNTVLSVTNASEISIINDFEVKNSKITEGVINLTNLAISSTMKSRVNIHDNENMKYVIKIENGSSWYADTDSELNMRKNTLSSQTTEQAVLLLNGTLQVAGELNVSSNVILAGNGIKAGILVGEKGLIQVKSAVIEVENNIGSDIFQVYSKNVGGFIEGINGYKFKAGRSKMKVAFPEPYTGIIFKYYDSNRVEDIDSVDIGEVFEAERGSAREDIETTLVTRDNVPCVILSKSLANIRYSVKYSPGIPTDSQGLTYSAGSDIFENNKSGSIVVLRGNNAFNMEGFRLTKWVYERTGVAYDPGVTLGIDDLQIRGNDDELIFTAQWVEVAYNIQYSVAESNATLVQNTPTTTYYYRTAYLSEEAATRPDYILSGWEVTEVRNKYGTSVSSDLVGKTYGKADSVSRLIDIEDGTVVLKALWEVKQVVFRFNIQGKTASDNTSKSPDLANVATQNAGMGTTIRFVSDGAEMKGFTLIGYRDTGKNRTFDLDTGYTVSASNFTIVNNEVNLVSVWEENKYTVRLTKEDSDTAISGSPTTKQLSYYEKYSIKQNTYTKPGYRIKGWAVDKIMNATGTNIDIDSAYTNKLIEARSYQMPESGDGDIEVSQLLDVKNGSIDLKAVLENTHKHYRNGSGTSTNAYNALTAYEPLRQVDVNDGILRGKFGTENQIGVGSYFLTENVTLKYSMEVRGAVVLCLNGYDLDMNGYSFKPVGNEKMFQLFICSCRETQNNNTDNEVLVYDADEKVERLEAAFDGYTALHLNATLLNGAVGHLNIAVSPFGMGSGATSIGENVKTTMQDLNFKRGSRSGSSDNNDDVIDRSNRMGTNSSQDYSPTRAQSSGGSSSGNGGGTINVNPGTTDTKLKQNLETTKNILDMLYAININKILTDTTVYDNGDFVDLNGKLQYIINNETLKSGLYKIKVGNKTNIYSFDKDGYVETGIKMINNEMYFFKDTGEMAINEKVIYGNVEYDIDELGVIQNRTILQINSVM